MTDIPGSIPVGRVRGIAIKVHVLFLVWIAFELIAAPGVWTLVGLAILFGSVFLHELGHCWGARRVGGDAQQVVMWPLGGLATLQLPQTWKAELVSTAAGPAVNLLLLIPAAALIGAGVAHAPASLYPLDVRGLDPFSRVVVLVGAINLGLFLFNVLPAYPMDGGRLLRSGLWPLLRWRRATIVAAATAVVFGLAFVGLGIASSAVGLALIGVLVTVYSGIELRRAWRFTESPEWDDLMPHERG